MPCIMWMEPSSLHDANSGYELWKETCDVMWRKKMVV